MYSSLSALLSDKKGGEVFTCFSLWHILYIALAAVAVAVLLPALRGKGRGVWNKTAKVLINIAFSLYVLDFFAMPLAYGEIDVEKLPFHVCTAMCVASFLSNHSERLSTYRRSLGLLAFISNFVYLVYPAGVMWHAVHPTSYRVVQTLIFHAVMTVYGLIVIVIERDSFRWRDCYTDALTLGAMTLWALLGNLIYNSDQRIYNWFFVVRDPFYLIPEHISVFVMPLLNVLVFFSVEMLMYLIVIKLKKKNKL